MAQIRYNTPQYADDQQVIAKRAAEIAGQKVGGQPGSYDSNLNTFTAATAELLGGSPNLNIPNYRNPAIYDSVRQAKQEFESGNVQMAGLPQQTQAISQNANGDVSIPWKLGGNRQQFESIQNLVNTKPVSQWTDTDKKNWAYWTEGKPLPQGIQAPAAPEIPTTPININPPSVIPSTQLSDIGKAPVTKSDINSQLSYNQKLQQDYLNAMAALQKSQQQQQQRQYGIEGQAIPQPLIGSQLDALKREYAFTQKPLLDQMEFAQKEMEFNKPISAGNSIIQYNPETGGYNTLYTAPAEEKIIGSAESGYYSYNPSTGKTTGVIAPQKKTGYTEVSPGATLFDPVTGKPVYTAPSPKKDVSETGLDYKTQTQVDALAKGFDSSPIVKNFVEVQNKKLSVDSIIDRGASGPGDLAIVYEFMKALDPTSVVRETEYATAAKSGNIFSGIFTKFNGYFKEEGGFLPENVKQQFKGLIGIKYNVAEGQYNNIYSETARKINMKTGESDGGDYLTNYSGVQPSITNGQDNGSAQFNYENAIKQLEAKGVSQDGILDILKEYGYYDPSQYSGYYTGSKSIVDQLKKKSSVTDKTAKRTDRHNNPTAFSTGVAEDFGLVLGKDYVRGDHWIGEDGKIYYTAKLIGNPVALTIKGIDKGGFYTQSGKQRWTHTAMSQDKWNKLSYSEKVNVVKQMYKKEGNKGLLNQYFA